MVTQSSDRYDEETRGPRRVRWLQALDRDRDANQKAKGMCADSSIHPAFHRVRNAKRQEMDPF